MSCRVHYFKGATETDAPNTYHLPSHVLIRTMMGATFRLPILTNVTVRSYDWA
jgi:hypothetical protein